MREDDKSLWRQILTPGTPACAVFCACLGVGAAVLLLTAGVWKTLLVALCVGLGAFLGGVKDKKAFVARLLDLFHRP